MTTWLIRHFIKNYQNVNDSVVRERYGTLAAVTGILANLLLATIKFTMGVVSGSLAVMADAANSLSDAAGSIVTLVTVRLSNKPVDQEHPFGHGRLEYIGSLTVGALILLMGFSLLKDSITAILHPEPLSMSWLVAAALAAGVAIKLGLYGYYRKLGNAVSNGTLLAASKDSLGDVLSTGAVLASVLVNLFFGFSVDGYIGLVVAVIVLKGGVDVCRDTLDRLLGGKPDPEMIQAIRDLLMRHEGILGVHDLVVHDYGPGRCVASVHAEVSADGNILTIHEMIDSAEREVEQKLHIPICIHMDPIVTSDETSNRLRVQMNDYLRSLDPDFSMHDFRMVPGQEHTNLIFDCVVPAGYQEKELLYRSLRAYAQSLDPSYHVIVQFDTDYT